MGRWHPFALVVILALASTADATALESLETPSFEGALADEDTGGEEVDPVESDGSADADPKSLATSLAPLWGLLPPSPAVEDGLTAPAAAEGSDETGAVPSGSLSAGNGETAMLPAELDPVMWEIEHSFRIPGIGSGPPPGSESYRGNHTEPEDVIEGTLDMTDPDPQTKKEPATTELTPRPSGDTAVAEKQGSLPLSRVPAWSESAGSTSPRGDNGADAPDEPSAYPVAPAPHTQAPSSGLGWDLAPLFAALGVLAGMVSAIHLASAFRGARYIPWFGSALFAHVGKKEALKHSSRQAIHQLVLETPGLAHGDLCRMAGLSRTATGYHIDILERHGFVRSVRAGRSRRYYAVQADVEAEPHALLLVESQRRVAECILMQPGIIQKGLCEALGIPASRASERLKRLVQAGLVTTRPFRQAIRYYPTALLHGSLSGPADRNAVAVA